MISMNAWYQLLYWEKAVPHSHPQFINQKVFKVQNVSQSRQPADEILLDCQLNYLGPKTKEI